MATKPAVNTQDFKREISVRLLERIANGLGMTVSDYGSVYDSEYHEQVLNEIMQMVISREADLRRQLAEDNGTPTQLQPFEVANYKRLMALESRGLKEYREMRAADTLTPESVVSFINQLSPWNLKTTGVDILEAYVQKLGKKE